MSAVVTVRGLNVAYGTLEVVKGVDLDVAQGEKVVIMGPSGSGKSTFLRSLIWLVRPKSGKIVIDGIEVAQQTLMDVRKRVGFVFQHYNLFPHLKVIDNIVLPLVKVHGLLRGEAVQRAREALQLVGLADKERAYPLQLSGGQQQRAAIARAIAIRPKVLMLDEPTSALDPELVEEVLRVLEDIARRGTTMLIVTHEIDFALDVADRVVFFEGGKIVEEGPPDILYNPKTDRFRQFLRRLHRRTS
ncbi:MULTISPECIES: amino acid ABC transporter ATP-binding protein [Pyrobaculum]|uniref:Amino acid ABC transporter ATP-binding protein, PAAT family n=2 Tax=Pyrobaculum arsenaticum TaxID=121277 RepID=A4WMJ8_PYRAR|nr:amino acid ABC transporter ATP-binding protein [Pyrobaculum arsenaticum]ABP51615.1 amino acid ABC transporter ATP-binding protein, PAAT family [Pyrobaculum arsenaticum DSM 13514]MCY0890652.1 amino acid ABC transporter ATP-binding protein [Pyrobaculum arsenaticum]NYR15934.1 amino acid ABC transporter ATP-binding protein [Pyrobaculum arsenaticum]